MRKFARLWEPIWSRLAAEVIVPNEAMAEEFFKRRRRRPVIVRNPVAPEAFASSERPWPTNAGQFKIIYTGSVYHAQSDAFINLLAALERLKDWSLHISTPTRARFSLAAYEIQGPRCFATSTSTRARPMHGSGRPTSCSCRSHSARRSRKSCDVRPHEDGGISGQRAADPGARSAGDVCRLPYSATWRRTCCRYA